MKKEQEIAIYKEAIDLFGILSQKIMVIEDMSELVKELCKELRDRGNIENIADELADVEITLAQIKMIYDIEKDVKKHKDFKLKRFASRMKEIRQQKSQQ